jgi:hypothetical protein
MARVKGFTLVDMKIDQKDFRRLNSKIKQLNKYGEQRVDDLLRDTAKRQRK